MEWVQLALSLGLTPLNIVLIGMVYFLGVKMELFPKFWGEDEEQQEKIPLWAQNLQTYFNHDTTEHHEKTHEKLDMLIRMEEKEHDNAQQFRDTLKDIGTTLANIEKYGVQCRQK